MIQIIIYTLHGKNKNKFKKLKANNANIIHNQKRKKIILWLGRSFWGSEEKWNRKSCLLLVLILFINKSEGQCSPSLLYLPAEGIRGTRNPTFPTYRRWLLSKWKTAQRMEELCSFRAHTFLCLAGVLFPSLTLRTLTKRRVTALLRVPKPRALPCTLRVNFSKNHSCKVCSAIINQAKLEPKGNKCQVT